MRGHITERGLHGRINRLRFGAGVNHHAIGHPAPGVDRVDQVVKNALLAVVAFTHVMDQDAIGPNPTHPGNRPLANGDGEAGAVGVVTATTAATFAPRPMLMLDQISGPDDIARGTRHAPDPRNGHAIAAGLNAQIAHARPVRHFGWEQHGTGQGTGHPTRLRARWAANGAANDCPSHRQKQLGGHQASPPKR